MKKLYSLFTIGALLFVACSENALPVSGKCIAGFGLDECPEYGK